ncbi:hypothetical protein BJX61DRAFT_537306 [Aspergillus egyptiacus]|nr:hypothetical protein BJX61DRAFT_537306 [Aspergillus egyptiacus]
MHAKYLTLLGLSSAALAQDWLEDAMDAAESYSNMPAPTGSSDMPTLDEYLSDSDYMDDIQTTTFGGGGGSDSFPTSAPTSSSFPDMNLNGPGGSDSDMPNYGGMFSDIPSSIITDIMNAVPSTFAAEMTNPASVSSFYSAMQEGNYPAWVTDLPEEARDYFESAAEAAPTGNGGSDNEGEGGDEGEGEGEGPDDAAGMVTPSVLASMLGALGVMAVAIAL